MTDSAPAAARGKAVFAIRLDAGHDDILTCGTRTVDSGSPLPKPRGSRAARSRVLESVFGIDSFAPGDRTPPPMARVVLEKVTKIYPGGVRAVDAIDLSVADREFVVLVGPSGCGKTTTLRMVAGLEEITGGVIRIGERVVNDVPPKDRDIAMVFQNYALYPHMTVYKNMAFGLKLRRMPKAEIHAAGDARRRRFWRSSTCWIASRRHLSGGQKQRVAVGRAIVREPAAFLFDEPLSISTPSCGVTTRAELKRLHQRLKTTTIYVTHDQEEAMTLGDRIVVMKDGVIQQADAPLATYNQPANRFVAGFIGMPPMNFFDGALEDR